MPGTARSRARACVAVQPDALLQPSGDLGRAHHRRRAGPVHGRTQPLPRRHGRPGRRVGGDPQAPLLPRPGRAGPEPVHEPPVAAEGLLPRDLLLDDAGHQRVHDQAGPRDVPRGIPALRTLDLRVVGDEAAVVVGVPEQLGHLREHPLGTGAPCGGHHLPEVVTLLEAQGGRAGGRRQPQPPAVAAVGLERRVAAAATQDRDEQAHRHRPRRAPHATVLCGRRRARGHAASVARSGDNDPRWGP